MTTLHHGAGASSTNGAPTAPLRQPPRRASSFGTSSTHTTSSTGMHPHNMMMDQSGTSSTMTGSSTVLSGGSLRRQSSTSGGSGGPHAWLSTLESSHNDNNRVRRGDASTSLEQQQALYKTQASMSMSKPLLQHRNSTGNLQQQQQQGAPPVPPGPTRRASSATSTTSSALLAASNKQASDGKHGGNKTVVIEEKRRRLVGSSSKSGSYTVHKYLRGRLLGKGGFAKVYVCTALDTGKEYAVKIVPKANLVKSRARQKLQAEIKIHKTLDHAHVCCYKHFFEDAENCYILLELCHNQSMNEMIKRRKRLTELEAAYFLQQLLSAVRYMHEEQSVIHRDLKLGNLFLDRHLHIKVGDLGLATRVQDRDEKRKTICGTPNYIAPEVINSDKAKRGHSFPVDIWSMGVILFTLLTGKPPYEAKDVKATYQRILHNEYRFPSSVQVSDCAKDLIQSMLQTDPSLRPTLDDIEGHPFLADKSLPESLPCSVTHESPLWRVDETTGRWICIEKDKQDSRKQQQQRKPSLPRVASSSGCGSASAAGNGNGHRSSKGSGSNHRRQPFVSRDPNTAGKKGAAGETEACSTSGPPQRRQQAAQRTSSSSTTSSSNSNQGRQVIDIYGIAKTALGLTGREPATTEPAASSNSTPTILSSPGFEIFDDSQQDGVEVMASPVTTYSEQVYVDNDVNDLASRTRSLSLGTGISSSKTSGSVARQQPKKPVEESTSSSSTATGVYVDQHSPESDAEVLQRMVDRLDTVLDIVDRRKGSYRSSPQQRPLSRGGPNQWISRYVDYTTKYGLGFLLNQGSSGVYFNDSTKVALEADGDTFVYIDRSFSSKKSGSSSGGTTTLATNSLSNYPESLKKKVTLLKHFRNYLVEQQTKSEDYESGRGANGSAPLVFVKKWLRTKHAILFRLSDQTVQVVFYDQTEVLLTADDRFITYVDKSRNRNTYHFTDELVGGYAELAKRIKYTKDILEQFAEVQQQQQR